jgi:uncharacterized membrane protein
MLEVVAISLDGAHTAEATLAGLRAGRDDDWLAEVSIIEHDADGRFSVKAKNPHIEDRHTGKGAAIGGLTGLFVGVISGPLGLVIWSTVGMAAGATIGSSKESTFLPLISQFEACLRPDASMLVLVGERPVLDALVDAVNPQPGAVMREKLTSDQMDELSQA